MSAPKSVVKFSKNGIEYLDEVEQAQYYVWELAKRGLMDVGRFVVREFNNKLSENFKRHTGNYRRATRYKVWSNKNTKFPRVDIGLQGNKGFYAYFQEFGSSKTRRLGLLSQTVNDNTNTILEIESKYLSAIETNPDQYVDEDEIEGGED